MQVHTLNLAAALAAAGMGVDLWIRNGSFELTDVLPPEVRIVDFDPKNRLMRKLMMLYQLVMARISITAMLAPLLPRSRRLMRERHYDALIGIEKLGMIWAGLLAPESDIPFVYYSLELYDETHPAFQNQPGFALLRSAEKRFHRKARATIVQDAQRGEHVLRANGVTNELIFLPVSVPGLPIRTRSNWLREKFVIPADVPVVLYAGVIDEERRCLDVARVAAAYKDRIAFVFHGYGDEPTLAKMRAESGGAAILSTELVPAAQLPEVVASADVGLAIYRTDYPNDRLTAFSSEKVALYCKAGVPFIAFDTDSYRALLNEIDCGRLVKQPQEIPEAVAAIMADHERLRENAFTAFERYYRFETNFGKALARLRACILSSV